MKTVVRVPDEIRRRIVMMERLTAAECEQFSTWLTYWLSSDKNPIVVDPQRLIANPFKYLEGVCESREVFNAQAATAAALLPKGLMVQCRAEWFEVCFDKDGQPDRQVAVFTGYKDLWRYVSELWQARPTKFYGVAEVDALFEDFE